MTGIEEDAELLLDEMSTQYSVKEKPPWHVTESSCFLVDISTFANRNDVSIDCWHWRLDKTYITSSASLSHGNVNLHKGNDENCYRVVRRIFLKKSPKF